MIAEGVTAYNPQTGQTAVFTSGKWVVQGSPQMGATMSPTDQEAMKSLQGDSDQSQWLAQKADQFRALQQGKGAGDVTGTGPQYSDIGIPHIAENINPLPGIAAAVNPRFAGMESISNQAWAHMRPQGSGPLRMPEVEGFQQAFPSVQHTAGANSAIADRLDQDANYAAQKLQFIDNYIRQNRGTYADANAAWEGMQRQSGNGGVVFGQGAPVQGQTVTTGQQNYAATAGQPRGQAGSPTNPYYDWQGGQPPPGASHVTPDGRLAVPGGQITLPQPQMPQPGQPQQPPAQGGWSIVGVS